MKINIKRYKIRKYILIIGLIDLVRNFKFKKWTIEQFPPGCYAKYQLAADMKCDLVEEKRFYEIGKRPYFTPWLRYESKFVKLKIHNKSLFQYEFHNCNYLILLSRENYLLSKFIRNKKGSVNLKIA